MWLFFGLIFFFKYELKRYPANYWSHNKTIYRHLDELVLFFFFFKDTKVKSFAICASLQCVYHIGIMVRLFANGLGDLSSIPGQVIPKTQTMVLDDCLNTQHYKVRIKGKVEQSKERSNAFSYTLVS